ncbi:MAG: lipocalin family protein [Mycobacterium sp.]
MGSMRVWLGSGAVLAGVGTAMLCGAGVAAADAGDAPGVANPEANAVATSPGVAKGVRQKPGAGLRLPGAAAAAAAHTVTSAASVSASAHPAATAVATPAGVGGASRVSRRQVAPTPTPIPVVPSPDPVDPAQFAGTYYEQGSVKQFFSIGLVNTKAVYSLNSDGTIRVQNSGNYFFNGGPQSSIVGSAVPVNANNTALNVSFFGQTSSATPPGNYTILAHAPDYNWVIVSDPSGNSGYILTRNQTITPQEYQQLLAQARALGVRGPITPTTQYGA